MRTNYNGSNQNSSNSGGNSWSSMANNYDDRRDDAYEEEDFEAPDMSGYSFDNIVGEAMDDNGDSDVDAIFNDGSDAIFEGDVEESLRSDLVQAYKDIYEGVSSSIVPVPSDIGDVSNPYGGQVYEVEPKVHELAYEDVNEVEPQRGMKKRYIFAIIASVLILSVSGTMLFLHKTGRLSNGEDTVSVSSEVSFTVIRDEIDGLYIDSFKSDVKQGVSIKELEALRLKLDSLAENRDSDFDVNVHNDMLDELDTIELYLKDSSKLAEYESPDCSFDREDIDSNLKSIESDIRAYGVSGLRTTMSNRYNDYVTSRDDYVKLRDELLAIKDPLTYDESIYSQRINAVSHTANRSYLQSISNKLLADKTVAQKQKEYEEADDSEKDKLKKELEEASSERDKLAKEAEEKKKAESEKAASEKAASEKAAKEKEASERAARENESKRDIVSEIKEHVDSDSPVGEVIDDVESARETVSEFQEGVESAKEKVEDFKEGVDSAKEKAEDFKEGVDSAKDKLSDLFGLNKSGESDTAPEYSGSADTSTDVYYD